jgi:creatinine amidohydrolase
MKIALMMLLGVTVAQADEAHPRGRKLAAMSWVDAKAALRPETVVVIPLGAESKEHGPHLPLSTDYRQAEYYSRRVLAESDVVVAPTMNYGFYPAFVEYPGSTSLSEPVARDSLLDVVRGLAKFGPHRFYVINIGVSTNKPLSEAVALLALEGIALRYLDLTQGATDVLEKPIRKEREGSHANEIETSIMLAIDAGAVDMSKAVADYGAGKGGAGPLSTDPKSPRYSPSGIYGDATLASVEKGRLLLDGITRIILSQIEELRHATPPAPARIFGRLTPAPPPSAGPKR